MTHLDLFSGIGGFAMAFEAAGFKTIGFSEIDPYASAVLRKHWPGVPNYGDVRNVTADKVGSVDVVTGGFPCQPFSCAGERRGDSDERFLWPECVRILREIRPAYALFENVPGLLSIDRGRTFNRVLSDLVSVRYDCLWNCVPACAVGAPHERDRVWILAYTESQRVVPRWHSRCGNETGFALLPSDSGKRIYPEAWQEAWFEVSTRLCRVGDGIPNFAQRGECLGNSIVPQVAYIFAKAIKEQLT